MAETSTLLVRSFSTPVDTSCALHESNPLRALGESISFGRFMTESLNWEKWSTFTQNRYVEEAEKYSKPGSVAAKRAYFEAHYKRKAAEKDAALVQEANAQANETFESETRERNCADSSEQIKLEADNIETANEEINNDTVNYQGVDCDCDANQCKCDVGENDLDISEVEGIEEVLRPYNDINLDVEQNCTDSSEQKKSDDGNIEAANEDTVNYLVVDCYDTNQHKFDVGQNDLDVSHVEGTEEVLHPCNDMNLDVECCVLVDNSNQLDHVEVHKNIDVPVEETAPDPGITDQEVLALSVKEREVNSSPKSSAKIRADKLPHSRDERKAFIAVPPRSRINCGLKRENSIGDAVERKILTARSLHTSINLPSSTAVTSKTGDASLRSRYGIHRFSTSKSSVGSLVEKKRLTTSSHYMSINVPSGTGVASKTTTTALKPSNRMNIVPKSIGASLEKRPITRSLHMSINLSSGAGITSKTTSMIEHNSIKKIHGGLPKVHPVASQTSTEASRGLSNQAPANLPSVGRSCLKSSSTTKSNPRSATISSPFRFRSNERAIKRKEFLQRMDKTKSKEEEKVQLQRISKDKTEHDHQKQSSGTKSKQNDDGLSGSQSSSNQTRKISLTSTLSPRLVRKASSSTTKNLGSSWKPPISANNSKRISEKNNQTTRQSGTSLSKTRLENASPNIQH
ncbi:uncharacterized protein [Cicer arietinum]|uniref:Uncharacterized protein LOC101494186 isoform X2 n=1 Tax=Cicer arietinum TaxID=3827 RepID=A0A1S2YBC7_CICAR|nr:uncharacterized protein LOC101494186 isoform X2 [Cicer arietinum]